MSEERYRDQGRGRRKSLRRDFHYSAKLLARDAKQWDAFIVDISESGAQLELTDARDVPDEFSLLIGGKGAVNRQCRVVWRSNERLGVTFMRQPQRLPSVPNGRFWESLNRKRV
jgi:PilZ domain